ncbi:MAG: ribosome biogenesis domain-containing protein [Thermoplasmata archaeon]
MRSSGSTRRPSPDGPLALYLEVTGDDHPKACTGRRLLHRGLARPVNAAGRVYPAPVVLDPYAEKPLSAVDRRAAVRGGLLAVDCSWNRLSARGGFSEETVRSTGPGLRRRLPILIAANPQHYGRIAELNTVEALSAALYVLGRREEAAGLLQGFRGGEGFLEINRERLDAYAAATSPDAVRAAEQALYGGPAP